MKVEWRTIAGASFFLFVIFLIYILWSNIPTEAAGVVMLLFGGIAYGMLGTYLIAQYIRRHRIPRAEDRFDAEQSDGAGAVAYFPAASIWPAGVGLGAAFIGLAFIFGNWYWVVGLPLLFGALIGWLVESEHTLDLEEDVPEELQQRTVDTTAPPGHHLPE